MNHLHIIWNQLLATGPLEMVGVVFGILTAWYSLKEHIWVYPTGIINTLIYIYISLKSNLFGEASLNVYYTLISIYGWIVWAQKKNHHYVLKITYSSKKDLYWQFGFFGISYTVLFSVLTVLKSSFTGAIPWADALASTTAYTGMLMMTRKKIECWYWFAFSNAAAMCLYSVKGYQFTAFQFLILFVMAIPSYFVWRKRYLNS